MRHKTIERLKDTDFKRLTGVQRASFDLMLEVVQQGMHNFGRPTTLSRANQLLMTLIYWREHRTEFHIAKSYGVSESTASKKSKYHALTKREKQRNRALARRRILTEHIFRKLKVLRILSERYRNCRKRFALRFCLIAALYNLELTSTWLLQEVYLIKKINSLFSHFAVRLSQHQT